MTKNRFFRSRKSNPEEFDTYIAAVESLKKCPSPARAYGEAVAENTMKAWINRHSVKRSAKHTCFARLVGKMCPERRRCRRPYGIIPSDAPPCRPPASDHISLWIRDGKPVVFVSQPYHITPRELKDLVELCDAHKVTLCISANSWHFPHSTLLIELWAPGVNPADDWA